MLSIANWLDEQLYTIYEQVPEDNCQDDEPSAPVEHPIDEAMNKLALAVAAFQRAGQHFSRKSEAFRIFAAGSWNQHLYNERIHEASRKLPKQTSVQADVSLGEGKVEEAIRLLGQEGFEDDARDLKWALKQYRKGGFPL